MKTGVLAIAFPNPGQMHRKDKEMAVREDSQYERPSETWFIYPEEAHFVRTCFEQSLMYDTRPRGCWLHEDDNTKKIRDLGLLVGYWTHEQFWCNTAPGVYTTRTEPDCMLRTIQSRLQELWLELCETGSLPFYVHDSRMPVEYPDYGIFVKQVHLRRWRESMEKMTFMKHNLMFNDPQEFPRKQFCPGMGSHEFCLIAGVVSVPHHCLGTLIDTIDCFVSWEFDPETDTDSDPNTTDTGIDTGDDDTEWE